MKKIIAVLCMFSLSVSLQAGNAQRPVTTKFINHPAHETAQIKRWFSQKYLKDHAKTFDTKILPRLEYISASHGGKLIYRHAQHGTARLDLSKCKMGTVRLIPEEPKFLCDAK